MVNINWKHELKLRLTRRCKQKGLRHMDKMKSGYLTIGLSAKCRSRYTYFYKIPSTFDSFCNRKLTLKITV